MENVSRETFHLIKSIKHICGRRALHGDHVRINKYRLSILVLPLHTKFSKFGTVMTNLRAHSRSIRAGRWSDPYQAYSVTKCRNKNFYAPLSDPRIGPIITDTFLFHQSSSLIRIGAFVIMPDHYHFIFQLKTNQNLSMIIRNINRYASLQILKIFPLSKIIWQDSFYDHQVRTYEDLYNQMAYIENNPVRKGLIEKPEHWPYSSANLVWKKHVDRSWCW